jgi:hypothetical protein
MRWAEVYGIQTERNQSTGYIRVQVIIYSSEALPLKLQSALGTRLAVA